MMYSAQTLNKQGDNIQPYRTPLPILNQSVVPCPVLMTASWPTYRFLMVLYNVVNQQGSLRLGVRLRPPGPHTLLDCPKSRSSQSIYWLTCYLLGLQLSSYNLENSSTDSILLPGMPWFPTSPRQPCQKRTGTTLNATLYQGHSLTPHTWQTEVNHLPSGELHDYQNKMFKKKIKP